MNSTAPNHKPQRKQLSDQLDRFEQILDGLSEGLNDAITDAARRNQDGREGRRHRDPHRRRTPQKIPST